MSAATKHLLFLFLVGMLFDGQFLNIYTKTCISIITIFFFFEDLNRGFIDSFQRDSLYNIKNY